MFNLNEAFKQGYQEYLKEEAETNFIEAFEALEESQKEAEKSFQVVQDYFQLYALSEGQLNEAMNDATSTDIRQAARDIDKDVTFTGDLSSLSKLIGMVAKDAPAMNYKPEVGNATITKITDMKFPQNIIFFLQALINWISNLVKRVISAFTNGIQRLFGLAPATDFVGDLKLNLAKVKNIESFSMPVDTSRKPSPIMQMVIDSRKFEDVSTAFSRESLRDHVEFTDEFGIELSEADFGIKQDEKNKEFGTVNNNTVKGIMIDVSREMEELEQVLNHFLDLFDNAYGSNQEHLFETEDLELLLELFSETMASIAGGRVPTYALQGKLTELDVINKSRLRDNLIRTKINIDNLKRAYVDTQRTAVQKLQVITQKQLFASQGLGNAFKFYSAATYTRMINILEVLEPRVKEAKKLEKQMQRMEKTFNNIVVDLGKKRRSIMNFGDITYTPVYQKKINDLFEASRYVSQTITLRLTALGLYIKELKDVQEAILNANSINSRSKDLLKRKVFKKSFF